MNFEATRFGWTRRAAEICRRRRALVLTYDDGPGAGVTPRLLDVLGEEGVLATFFALGRNAARNARVLDRAACEGHEIGSHTFEHRHPWKSLPWDAARDAVRGIDETAKWSSGPRLFRPPYGKTTPWTRAAVRARGAEIAWWTIDSGDTWALMPPVEHVVARARREGGVVLMHDFERSPEREAYTSELTRRLAGAARADGLVVVPLGSLLRAGELRDVSAQRAALE